MDNPADFQSQPQFIFKSSLKIYKSPKKDAIRMVRNWAYSYVKLYFCPVIHIYILVPFGNLYYIIYLKSQKSWPFIENQIAWIIVTENNGKITKGERRWQFENQIYCIIVVYHESVKKGWPLDRIMS